MRKPGWTTSTFTRSARIRRDSSASGARSSGLGFAPAHVPREPHVCLRRPEAADCEPEHIAPAEPRVRDEDLAGGIDALDQPLVVGVRAGATEADDRERARRDDLPA